MAWDTSQKLAVFPEKISFTGTSCEVANNIAIISIWPFTTPFCFHCHNPQNMRKFMVSVSGHRTVSEIYIVVMDKLKVKKVKHRIGYCFLVGIF